MAFHLVSATGSVDSIKLVLDKGMSFNLTDTQDSTPLRVSARMWQRESKECFVQRCIV